MKQSVHLSSMTGALAIAIVGGGASAQCVVECPPGATSEIEACGEGLNDGCNLVVPAFQSIAAGETVCGTVFSSLGGNRDTDWYEIVTTEPMIFTWEAEAEFEVVVGYVPTSPVPGLGDCSTVSVLEPFAVGDPCTPTSITTDCLPPGTHWFFIAPPLDSDVVCGVSDAYVATLTAQACTLATGACCLPNLECVDGLTEAECVLDNAGVWQGDGTDCANTDCTSRPCPTDLNSILLQQMVSEEVLTGNGIACGDGVDTTDNGFARSYDLSTDPQTMGEDFTVTCVEMGIETSGSIGQPAVVNIYQDTDGGAPIGPDVDLTLLGSQEVIIPADVSGEILGFTLAAPVLVPADSVMVVEVFVFDTGTNGGIWPGTNDQGQSGPSYIRAQDCGLPTFDTLASLGFPDVHYVQTVVGFAGQPVERMILHGSEYDPAQPITDPTLLPLVELFPNFDDMWDVLAFADNNGNGFVDAEDDLTLQLSPPDGGGEIWTVEETPASLVIEEQEGGPVADWIYLEFQSPWTGNPLGAYREVHPLFGGAWVVLDWIDNGTGVVDECDFLLIAPPGGGEVFFHVVNLATDIGVRMDAPPDPCPEDIVPDGEVNVLDLLAVLAAWDALGGPADVNNDGIVDVLDLLAVLAAWGPCP